MVISGKRLRRVSSTIACFAIIMVSGNPYLFNYIPAEVLWPSTLTLLVILLVGRSPVFSKSSIYMVSVFGAITIAHLAIFGGQAFTASVGFMAMLTCAFLASTLIEKFSITYVNILACLAAVSLAFYCARISGILGPQDFAWVPGASLDNGWVHIGVFNFQKPEEFYRNSGPFWEPGAFAGYLVVGLLFMVSWTERPARWKLLVIIAALLTTRSTTGYLAGALLLFLFIFRSARAPSPLRLTSTVGLAGVALMIMMLLYTEIPFLKNKVQAQTYASNMGFENYEITRYGSVLYDFRFISERPLLGWSASPNTRQIVDADFADISQGQGNGATGFAAKFGVFALLFYLWKVYALATRGMGFARFGGIVVVALFLMLLFGEQFLNFPLFWCLVMVPPSVFNSDRDAFVLKPAPKAV